MFKTATTHNATQLREVAIEAVQAAGAYAKSVFRQPMDIEHKTSAHDQVTVHDRAAEDIVREVIARRCPGSTVAGEEAGAVVAGQPQHDDDTSDIIWHVDPIDGTSNFAQGLAFFCTAIAVEIDGVIRAAAIYDPMADLLFSADDDAAYLNGEVLVTPEVLPLPSATLITGYPTAGDLAAEGPSATERFQKWVQTFSSVRRTGSGALSILHVAAGWADASLGTGINAWDVAAAMLILRRAGGHYTPIHYTDPETRELADHHAPGYLAVGPGAQLSILEAAVTGIEQVRQV